jgi:iron complex transport system substrate-binding protein
VFPWECKAFLALYGNQNPKDKARKEKKVKKKAKWLGITLFCLLLVLSAMGCSQTTPSSVQESAQKAKQTAFPVTIKDATGIEVTMTKEPKRIVSIIPSSTEIAFALGLGAKVVGVTSWDNYPAKVKAIQKVGGLDVNAEKVVSLQPDLILAHPSNGKAIQALRKLGLNVLVVDAKSLDGTFASIKTIGKATGTEKNADELITQMKKERDEVVQAVSAIPREKRKKVWLEVDPKLFTAGKNTFMDELIGLAGGVNVMHDTNGWSQVSEEKVLAQNPDVIFVTYGYYMKNAVEQVKQRKNWRNLSALKTGQVYELDSDLVNRPGPRITQGLKQMAAYLYPDRFTKK